MAEIEAVEANLSDENNVRQEDHPGVIGSIVADNDQEGKIEADRKEEVKADEPDRSSIRRFSLFS